MLLYDLQRQHFMEKYSLYGNNSNFELQLSDLFLPSSSTGGLFFLIAIMIIRPLSTFLFHRWPVLPHCYSREERPRRKGNIAVKEAYCGLGLYWSHGVAAGPHKGIK